jgi:hypothetical protein
VTLLDPRVIAAMSRLLSDPIRCGVLLLVLLAALLALARASAAEPGWRALEALGEVRAAEPGARWQPLASGAVVLPGSRVATGTNGHLILGSAGASLTLGPGAVVALPAAGAAQVIQEAGTVHYRPAVAGPGLAVATPGGPLVRLTGAAELELGRAGATTARRPLMGLAADEPAPTVAAVPPPAPAMITAEPIAPPDSLLLAGRGGARSGDAVLPPPRRLFEAIEPLRP